LRDGHGQRTAVVFRGVAFELAAILFNVIWWHACHDRRLLTTTIDSAGVRAIGRRFRLAVAWIATGTLLGAVLPALGAAVIAALIPCYWLPIAGELEVGLNAVAAPIRGHDGTVVAAVSASGPSYRLDADRFPEVATAVQAGAAEISVRIGYLGS